MPGLRPLLHALWPDLHGRELRETAAQAFSVHVNTVYEWERLGMAKAAAENAHIVQEYCRLRLGEAPPLDRLLQASNP